MGRGRFVRVDPVPPASADVDAALHETHVCRECGAVITIPYARPEAAIRAEYIRSQPQSHYDATWQKPDPTVRAEAGTLDVERLADMVTAACGASMPQPSYRLYEPKVRASFIERYRRAAGGGG